MKRTLCYCSPAYGALMHALPRDASALKQMTDKQLFDQAAPWVNRVPPQTEVALHAWAAKAINPHVTDLGGLGGLGDLAELAGIGKRLKKLAKKIEKNKIVKKLVKPLAYVVGAATGTLAFVAQADKARTKARNERAKAIANANTNAPAPDESAAMPQPEPEQAAPVYQPPYTAQQSFAPVQTQYTTTAPRPVAARVQYEQPSYQAPQHSFAETRRQEPQTNPFIDRFNTIQRLAPANNEADERTKIVGLSRTGVMDSIKANPIPWTVGGLGLGLILYRAMTPVPRQRAY